MKTIVKILEDGKSSNRVVLEVTGAKKSFLPSPPPTFSELPVTGERKSFFREVGTASQWDIQTTIRDWLVGLERPYVELDTLVKGVTVEIKGEVNIRVKSPKK